MELREGPALDSLPLLAGGEPFDLIFIDADKPNNPAYLEWALQLARPGAAIVGDNVARGGAVANVVSQVPQRARGAPLPGGHGRRAEADRHRAANRGRQGLGWFSIAIVNATD